MQWFNPWGLGFMAIIMIPNIVFAVKNKDGFINKWNNKFVEITEQIGRIGCFCFMIINIPKTSFGWWFNKAFTLYLVVNTLFILLYCLIFIICFHKNSVFRSLALSVIPSAIFILSGIISGSVLLTVFAVLFAPSHIILSYKNAVS